jgi:hypothetical protein
MSVVFVYKISRFYSKQGKLTLGEYMNKQEEVHAMARMHTEGHFFISGLMMAAVRGEDVSFTFERNPELQDAKVKYQINYNPSLLESLDFSAFEKVPCDDNGVSSLTGYQLHVELNSGNVIKTQEGAWTVFRTVDDAVSILIVKSGDADYVNTGSTMNLSDSLDILFKTTQKDKVLTREQARESILGGVKRTAARPPARRKTSSNAAADNLLKVESIETNSDVSSPAASLLERIKAGGSL